MGFHRNLQPRDPKAPGSVIQAFVAIDTSTPPDPFRIDHDCLNPAGHSFIGSCGDVVCVHCAKVVWS